MMVEVYFVAVLELRDDELVMLERMVVGGLVMKVAHERNFVGTRVVIIVQGIKLIAFLQGK